MDYKYNTLHPDFFFLRICNVDGAKWPTVYFRIHCLLNYSLISSAPASAASMESGG